MGIYIFGAGGHAKVVLDAFTSAKLTVSALIDPARSGETLFGVPIVASHNEVTDSEGKTFVVAIGDNQRRKSIYAELLEHGWLPISCIHASAVVSSTAKIGAGTFVSAGAIINADAVVGNNVIVNTAAVIEHDCRVEDHAHIAPKSVMGGTCFVGEGALLGIGSTMLPGKKLGKWSTAGAGSVIVRDIEDALTVVGNPAAKL